MFLWNFHFFSGTSNEEKMIQLGKFHSIRQFMIYLHLRSFNSNVSMVSMKLSKEGKKPSWGHRHEFSCGA